MPILDYTTEIPVSQTVAEVTDMLARRDIRRVTTLFDVTGEPAGLTFTADTQFGPREYRLPVRIPNAFGTLERERQTSPRVKATREQAGRIAWQAVKNMLETLLSLMDAGLATLDELLMPYQVTPSGETWWQLIHDGVLASRGTALAEAR